MYRFSPTTLSLIALSLVAIAPAALAQTGRTDPRQGTSPTVPTHVAGNASHGLCPVIVGNEDGPVIVYSRVPPC